MRTQNPPPLKACRFDSDLGHHVKIRSGQGQATAATESNSIQSDLISGRIPPLSHPQLSACRCQDGRMVCWFKRADGPTHHNGVDGADF
jgi:hypothetical protein